MITLKIKHMKKFLLSSFLLGALFSVAQNQRTGTVATPNLPVSSHAPKTYSNLNRTNQLNQLSKTNSETGSTWVNYVDWIEFVSPTTQVFNVMNLFPDSTIILGFDAGNQPVYPWIHKAGNYMDPSWNLQQTILTDKTTPYTLDSVSVGYVYDRMTPAGIVDTLIIQVIAENTALNYSLSDLSYQDIEYNQPTNDIKASTPTLLKIKYPLTINDTCSGAIYKQIKVATSGLAIAAGKKVGTVLSFKPGYTWTINDTLIGGSLKNAFFVLTSEQNGDNTDPTYYGTLNDFNSDMNMSYILDQSVRYNTNANGWNGYFLPTYAYTTPFAYETHDIGYRITVLIAGVKELEQKGFAIGQNYPNPFTSSSQVDYQLTKDASSVVFTVTDVMGRVISSEKAETTTGIHTVKLGSYAAGVYYYSLNVDGNISTKKMIVE
jgi:hypothetical protein